MNKTVWLFDLDSMLYSADAGIFYLISRRMTKYLTGRLSLPEEKASHLRQDYWHHYGTTLVGLQIHRPEIDVGDFLCQSHLLDEILAKLMPIEGTGETLGRLKGRKTVFSNGPSFCVRIVVNALGLKKHFDLLAGTGDFGLLYRPDRHAYLNICRLLATHPAVYVMVDGSVDSLHAAKMLGMRTVWFGRHAHPLPFTDAAVSGMAALAEWGGNVGP